MKTSTMVINRETAMLLWNKSFGKSCKVKDFTGREMIKAAYNDRGSAYGWNVDHILPQSKNGKTTESNLICCHILTNDEKADKFPCFSANGKKFEIVKVQNHYEIRQTKTSNSLAVSNEESNDEVNFFDSASGIRFFKKLKGIQNKKVFVGTVSVRLSGLQTAALVDFISELFSDKTISYDWDDNDFLIQIADHNMPQKEDTADMLDRCVLLNTYLGKYFVPMEVVAEYQIFYGVHNYSDKLDCLTSYNDFCGTNSSLLINELVRINTEAKQKIRENQSIGKDELSYLVYEYDYIYIQLAENLKKQVK